MKIYSDLDILDQEIEAEEVLLDLAKSSYGFAADANDELLMNELSIEISIRQSRIKKLEQELSQLLKKA